MAMKIRLDLLVVEHGLAPSRHQAQALIGAGHVLVNSRVADKAGAMVPVDATIELKERLPYVSRGGLKLAAGLEHFQIDPAGFTCADIGASTGGFTDCLLQHGATMVYAVDVGYGQLAWEIRQNQKVVVLEKKNARYLTAADIPTPLDLAVIDASFISLKLLIPPLLPLFRSSIRILALVKPQFEVGRDKVGDGVVRDPELHRAVLDEIRAFGVEAGLECLGIHPSPVLGPKGNQEFLAYFVRE